MLRDDSQQLKSNDRVDAGNIADCCAAISCLSAYYRNAARRESIASTALCVAPKSLLLSLWLCRTCASATNASRKPEVPLTRSFISSSPAALEPV